MIEQIVRGPLIVPRQNGAVDWFADGAIAADERCMIAYAGDWAGLAGKISADGPRVRVADGFILPPLIDLHIHLPQHPIRGKFIEGVEGNPPGGRLLAGLTRNVFPAEARCAEEEYCRQVVAKFREDTIANGVVGGAAYMTPSAKATEIALSVLSESWSVGLVLMNQNCPADMRTDEPNLERDVERLASRFGRRLIVTDRFAVAVDSPLRCRAVELAKRFGLRTQTHLNEQIEEKEVVEKTLYPTAASYTDVYKRDGLLDCGCICAHCVHMRAAEWATILASGATIAHCPTSNLLLGSGLMPLDEVIGRKIPYAIATDVGASPTVSLLAEVGRFVQVHAGKSVHATATEGINRVTAAPAAILGLEKTGGLLEAGGPMSFIEVRPNPPAAGEGGPPRSAEAAVRAILPANLDDPAEMVCRVTVAGRILFELT